MSKNDKPLDLCRPCMEAMKAVTPLTLVSAGINRKITCRNCGKRRYGGAYKIAGSPRRKS